MDRQRDLELILKSSMPLVVIETRDESGMLGMLQNISLSRSKDDYLPLFRWTITDGLQRLDISLEPQLHNAKPTEVLRHIRAVTKPGVYVLLDFHPYLQDPVERASVEGHLPALRGSTQATGAGEPPDRYTGRPARV